MKIVCLNVFLAFYLTGYRVPAANQFKTTPISIATKVDTTKSFKIGSYWATPKPSFKFDTLTKSSLDTLDLVISADYVYWPFGSIKNKSKFKSSLLKSFSVINKIDNTDNGPIEIQILKHNSSKLIFFFDNTDTAIHSDIYKGEIYDTDVLFINGIKVGIEISVFYKTFFDYFPYELINKYKVVVFESGVDGTKHIYSFEKNKLKSVKFISDYEFKADY